MSSKASRLLDWYARVAAFNIEELFSRKREPGPQRTVYVHQPLPDDFHDHKGRVKPEHVYVTNQVITSKYSIITFLPRNLLEQFRRVANIFFLVIAILQFLPEFATISGGVALLPLLVIIAITGLKDGYEDFKRHQSDRRINHSTTKVLRSTNFNNPNVSTAKSKTFVRGLPNIRRRRVAKRDPVSTVTESDPASPRPSDTDSEASGPWQKNPHWETVLWEDVHVGDMVKIVDNEAVPADILICATSEDEQVAFVETKNLDGETNLKSRHAVAALTHLNTAAACADKRNAFSVHCDQPDNDMYRLNATVTVNGEVSPVDLSMTLLRGTVLRNTSWVIGVVLCTGWDTKIILNSGGTPSKRSKVERQMNPQVFVNLVLLAAMAVVCGVVDSTLEKYYYPRGALWLYGFNRSDTNPSIDGLITWVFSLLTFQPIVPISLYISIEFVRTCQAAFIYFDADIWYDKTDQATIARSWNLSDDLGQIEYIFSDKTGTLTQNSMVFRQCSVGGTMYKGDASTETAAARVDESPSLPQRPVAVDIWAARRNDGSPDEKDEEQAVTPLETSEQPKNTKFRFQDTGLNQDLETAMSAEANTEEAAHARLLNGFFTVLALCHTVLTAIDATGNIEYKAQSPDEAALVQAAADVGFVFRGRDREVLTLQTPFSTELEKYELLHILEFTSARKRMSVVVRKLGGEDERLLLLSKGADNVIFERLKNGMGPLKEETDRHLSEFAREGLRTLTLAYKVLQEEEYVAWSHRYHEATIAMEDREGKIESVSDELEHDLRLLGATAIEDRLQDGVPETIADLKRAGIKIWVATGDKMETAIAIGRSTNLISEQSNIITLRGNPMGRPVAQQMANAMESFFPGAVEEANITRASTPSRDGERPIGLQRIDTGISIVGPGNGDRPGGFVLVADGAALLEAFATEENKSLLLRLAVLCEGVICCRVSPLQKAHVVRLVKDGLGSMTLAIGDGANDVSMIQAADVGVGISGEEGLQAVNSSDYAIGQFRFLKKLLLVHGHWSYARNGVMILNFFYKNIVPVGVLWWFQIYSGWSATFVFDYTYILFWNSIWTIAPVIGVGLFDRVLDSKTLMEMPELYYYGREGRWFGLKSFFVYMLDGVVQSVIIYFLILYTYFSTSSRPDGYDVAQYEFSTTMAIVAVMIANMFTGFSATVWTLWLVFAVFIGIVIVWAYTAIYSATATAAYLWGDDYYLFHSAYFWLSLPLIFVLAMAPRYIAKAWKFGFAPDDLDIVRYIQKRGVNPDLILPPRPAGIFALRRERPTSHPASRPASALSRRTSRTTSIGSVDVRRPQMNPRGASHTDMSTGLVSVDRGFDFATEEGGVAMRRMQTNLSERRLSSRDLPARHGTWKGKESLSQVLSLRRGLLKRKPSPKKGL